MIEPGTLSSVSCSSLTWRWTAEFRRRNAPLVVAKTPAERRRSSRRSGLSGPGTRSGWSASEARCLLSFRGCWPRLFRATSWRLLDFVVPHLAQIAIEFGGHINDRLWQGFWDFVFVISSFLLAVLFGTAGGNLVRGVPLDEHGSFTMAFFTNFGIRGDVGFSTGTRFRLPSLPSSCLPRMGNLPGVEDGRPRCMTAMSLMPRCCGWSYARLE